jgi:hypothetical protein
MRRALAAVLVLLTMAHAAETSRTEAAGLRMTVPQSWRRVPAAAETRAAHYVVPAAAGDNADTEFAVSFVGEGKGGTVEEHLDRWCARFQQPDGRSSRDAALVSTRTVNGLTVTSVDLSGTYVGPSRTPSPAGVSRFRMLGAVVEGKGGPWFLEMLGPAASVAAAKADYDALLTSLESHR